MAERVLTTRELNRALLARQHLLVRSRRRLVETLEQVGGLQAQYAPSAYIGLWSRSEGFALDDLTRALERRRAVQATLMRSTLHVVSARDFWPFRDGMSRARREWWTRTHGRNISSAILKRAVAAVRLALSDGVLGRNELVDICRRFDPDGGITVWKGLPLELVRVPPSGTWERRRADLFADATVWIPRPSFDEEAGLRQSSSALSRGARVPLPAGDTPAPVRFLPTWDATLLVHARRTLILPEEFRATIFTTKNPHSLSTFLVDGAVAGIWRIERAASRTTLMLEPFHRLSTSAVRELQDEGQGLVRLVQPDAVSYAMRAGKPAS